MTQEEFDAIFLQIFSGIATSVVATTNQAVTSFLSASTTFMSSAAQKALIDFHSLYFDPQNASQTQSNKDVDDLFDAIKTKVDAGGDAGDVQEDEEKKKVRLSLAAIQKELESIISLDQGVRQKLIPALAAVQFEDLVRQILDRQQRIWETTAKNERDGKSPNETVQQIKSIVGSRIELNALYKFVLKEPPPAVFEENENWLDYIVEKKR